MSSFKFVYEDSQEKSVNEDSSQALIHIIDEDYHGLETIATHSQFLESRNRDRISEVSESNQTENQNIIKFFKLKDEKLLSAKTAAKQLNISARVAQFWVKKYNEDPDNLFNHDKKEDTSVYVKDVMDYCILVFGNINVLKETVRRFMANKCNLTLKKIYKQSVAKNSEENIEAKYNWILQMKKTSANYMTNCVFLDKSAFDINMWHRREWFEKGKKEVTTTPTTRFHPLTIFGAMLAKGLIYISLRNPKFCKQFSSAESGSKGTVARHFFMFVKAVFDKIDKYVNMKGNFLVIDNAPIHQSADISLYISSR
ncbi:hypothetical protein PHYBLDRAFT_144167 [Phycomyces blakesleeanus NRRL 1555(-)]|uniref:Homeodomain-like DNA binding domain-containing transcription factor n=1 Tax=Phycomyces blakesleeanus (strain ATCC 8743b / DSM 1359 / FGSC 10004 / NBRC 33097 / NRRL 1555) TaxID=763407 RepID=A0A162NJK7_PHYB8|nr:hypothetical protein PHYBLDRAFT_144167 [Phycomyces blakesleeanus NRRL 1555(-)]OAD74808.1 hypothetical protein PHYBLDRAFT_144167 [Phycomyces blakesleeanus NRRL 1555(-)]|eukprot:XP_018292848.1 hypothetical protein PHYBLDRAFT_144167 [Phycomyces blakesleeanus NRRL 1555(-)]